jgi:hypothetical protein
MYSTWHIQKLEKVQFRTDFYNAFNHPQYVPGPVNGAEATGQTAPSVAPVVGISPNTSPFNRPDLSFTSHPRVIQMALRLNF